MKPKQVLASVYACGPNWGSEIGMGWNWVMQMSQHCQLTVITERGFQKDIEAALPTLDIRYPPRFHYIDIGEKGRTLFWHQGSYRFYSHYRKWQKEAYQLALRLVEENPFDLIHQLNMIGYREPGYLWKIPQIPYLIGPVGGYIQFPLPFLSILGFRDKLFFLARNIINAWQMQFFSRPHKAYKRAEKVLMATPDGYDLIKRYAVKEPILITETGAHREFHEIVREHRTNEKIKLIWIGVLSGRKALPIALETLAALNQPEKIELHVVGGGINASRYKKLSRTLGLENVIWHGKIPNKEVHNMLASSDALFFTSIMDATSTVIFEALQAGTPVLCHDCCGFGLIIDESCGSKIRLKNPAHSIDTFVKVLWEWIENPEVLKAKREGCLRKIESHYWEEKGKKMFEIYQDILEK